MVVFIPDILIIIFLQWILIAKAFPQSYSTFMSEGRIMSLCVASQVNYLEADKVHL